MNSSIYGHHHGDVEVADYLRADVIDSITSCDVPIQPRKAKLLRDSLIHGLSLKGWPPLVSIDPTSKISVTSIRDQVALCLQTGNIARMYADLLKLQTLYLRETISAGIVIVPSLDTAKKLGDNIANFDRLVRELQIFERAISVPILVLGVEP